MYIGVLSGNDTYIERRYTAKSIYKAIDTATKLIDSGILSGADNRSKEIITNLLERYKKLLDESDIIAHYTKNGNLKSFTEQSIAELLNDEDIYPLVDGLISDLEDKIKKLKEKKLKNAPKTQKTIDELIEEIEAKIKAIKAKKLTVIEKFLTIATDADTLKSNLLKLFKETHESIHNDINNSLHGIKSNEPNKPLTPISKENVKDESQIMKYLNSSNEFKKQLIEWSKYLIKTVHPSSETDDGGLFSLVRENRFNKNQTWYKNNLAEVTLQNLEDKALEVAYEYFDTLNPNLLKGNVFDSVFDGLLKFEYNSPTFKPYFDLLYIREDELNKLTDPLGDFAKDAREALKKAKSDVDEIKKTIETYKNMFKIILFNALVPNISTVSGINEDLESLLKAADKALEALKELKISSINKNDIRDRMSKILNTNKQVLEKITIQAKLKVLQNKIPEKIITQAKFITPIPILHRMYI